MERGTFPRIWDEFDPFVVARLDTEGDEKVFIKALQVRLIKAVILPQYVIVDPETEVVLKNWAWKAEFSSDPSTFSRLLREGLAVYKDRRGN